MVFCPNRKYGCPRSFSTHYGMKIHLRSCVNEEEFKKDDTVATRKKRKRGAESLASNSELSFRLPIDQGAFKNFEPVEKDVRAIEDLERVNEVLSSYGCDLTSNYPSPISTEERVLALLKAKLGRLGRKTSHLEIDGIIKLLAHPSFHLKSFTSSCSSYKECAREEEAILHKSLNIMGFNKRIVTDPSSGISCDVYVRSALDVLRCQIAKASNKSCFFQPPDNVEQYSHPMMAKLGQHGVSAVTNNIMGNCKNDVLWHDSVTSGDSSFVGLLQIYSDKSKTSLKESAFQFYPLHITLLNFSEEYRRSCIVDGSTFLAFLPVSFYRMVDGNKYQANVERPQKLRLLHQSMDIVLEEVQQFGIPGFLCKDRQGIRRRCHPCLVSYCCDLPEAKDMSSIRNGNSSERNCHRCLALTDTFNSYTTCNFRNGSNTVRTIEHARQLRSIGKRDEAELLMDEYSLADQIPSFFKLPFMGIHPILDMHFMYGFEPLHVFHLGISKELKKCLAQRLRSEVLKTEALPTKAGLYRMKTFRIVRMSVLNGINCMLSHIQLTSPAKGLRVDFSSTGKGDSGNGLYGDDGKLIGMLEAKDYRSVDMVFPFIGMLADRCCGEVSGAACTNIFVQYVDIMMKTMSYTGSALWTEEKVTSLERMIETFKGDATKLFGVHQKSRLRTEKFHQLDHIAQDIRRMGGIAFGDAGLYEYSHTLVKKAYKSGSRRRETAMDETLASFMKEVNHSSLNKLFKVEEIDDKHDEEKELHLNSAHEEAIRTDCPTLVKNGKVFSLEGLKRCRTIFRKLRKAKEIGNEQDISMLTDMISSMNETVSNIVKDVGEDGCRVLINQLYETCNTRDELSDLSADKVRLTRVTSGYVPGIGTPTQSDVDSQHRIMVKNSSARYSQRMVSGKDFYGSKCLRQDCVLLQANDSNSSQMELYVGKVLLMLRFPESNVERDENEDKGRNDYVFVQYFDVQPSIDDVDKALGCVPLRYARDQDDSNTLELKKNVDLSKKWFDLLPVSSIRGVVHVIRGDYGKEGRCVTQDIDEVPWYNQSFYINRFYFNTENRRYQYTT